MSVVIPVLDAEMTIRGCIDSLLSQTIRVSEIIAIDSGSTDGTLEILSRYPEVRVISIPASSFNHGETRNAGVRAATGEWVLLTVGDARAADDRAIENLLAGVLDDKVVAVCGKQIVPASTATNPAEWFNPVSAPRMERFQFAGPEEFDALASHEKVNACGWDDVCALYRRDVLLRIPFRPTVFGEDALWAKDALRAGLALVYNPDATVFHSHIETADYVYARTMASICLRYSAFGHVYHRPEIIGPLLRLCARILMEQSLTLYERVKWINHNVKNRLALRSAIDDFNRALSAGPQSADGTCAKYSARPPVPSRLRRPQA